MSTVATLLVRILADIKDYEDKMSGVVKGFDNVGKTLTRAGTMLTVGVTAPLTGMGLAAINAASNLEESMNKVQVVFGDSADSVVAFSSTASTSLGMSQQAALEATGTFGNLFTSMGMGVPEAADMSTSLVQLASDLASFNNIDPAEALDKLRAGLVGETEPLRTLGVNLSAAAVEAEALEMGLAATADELTPAMLAQARYALILEQTTNAQGDFARTSDGFANSMRTTKAEFIDAAAAIGMQLLPYVQQLLGYVQQGIAWFQGLNPEMQKWVVIVGVVAAAIGPVLIIVGSLISAIGAIIPIVTAVAGVLTFPLIAIIAAVVAIVALLAAAWKNNWGGIQEKTAAVVAWIKGAIQNFLAAIQAFWTAHGAQIMAVVKTIWDAITKIFSAAFDILKTLFGVWKAAFSGDWRKFGELLRELWQKAWDLLVTVLRTALDGIITVLKTLWPKVRDWFASLDWAQIGKNMITGIGKGITAAAGILKDIIQKVIKAAIAAAKGFLGIDSPSKVFTEMGKYMMLGMNLGIERYGRLPEIQVTKTVRGIVESAGEAGRSGSAPVIVYGGVNLSGVQDGRGIIEQLQDMGVA